jgi:hypothetical protein
VPGAVDVAPGLLSPELEHPATAESKIVRAARAAALCRVTRCTVAAAHRVEHRHAT